MPFLIRHPETRAEYELADVDAFVTQYQPRGFRIVDPPPTGYTVPAMPTDALLDDAPRPMTRAELNAEAARLGVESPEKLPNKEAVIEAMNLAIATHELADTPDEAQP